MDLSPKLLMVLHATAAVVLIGSTTHNGIIAFLHLRGRPYRPKLQRTYVRIMGWAYLTTFSLGLLNYPAFRLTVRRDYLDEQVPLAAAFFEVKEHWLGIGLLLLACYWPMSRTMDVRRRSPDATLYHLIGMTMVAIVWLAMFTGLIVAAIRPVGG